jgi:hypothetical protein
MDVLDWFFLQEIMSNVQRSLNVKRRIEGIIVSPSWWHAMGGWDSQSAARLMDLSLDGWPDPEYTRDLIGLSVSLYLIGRYDTRWTLNLHVSGT